MDHLKFHTISLKKRRNEARFVLNEKCTDKHYYIPGTVRTHSMTGLVQHFITRLLGTKAIFSRPFLKV